MSFLSLFYQDHKFDLGSAKAVPTILVCLSEYGKHFGQDEIRKLMVVDEIEQ